MSASSGKTNLPGREQSTGPMPTISLKVTRPSSRAPDEPLAAAKPMFTGTGDTDYLCGGCGAVMAAHMGPSQRVIVDRATCSACGAENEFPPNLRV